MLKPTYSIPQLPPKAEFETVPIFRELARASRNLAELKGRSGTIPNPDILIDTLSMQEAKASSEIENIITTQDEIFQVSLFPESPISPAAKEVALYRDALKVGFRRVLEQESLLTSNTIIAMFQTLKRTNGGYREQPDSALKNEASGELVYVPPQDPRDVQRLMADLERFMNEPAECDLDPLIKMAIIHHQFESIHPFPDGNGRIGRIINVLYITKEELLDIPILYLSRFITANKGEYYRLLQAVREQGAWVEWVIYMLRAVGDTALETLRLVEQIKILMAHYKDRLRSEHGKIYSQDLINSLFRHPYTRIDFLTEELGVTRQTAAKYLDQLTAADLLSKHRLGKHNYYMNDPLVEIFVNIDRKANRQPADHVLTV